MHRRHAGVHDLGTISARSRHDLGRISQVCIVCGETGSGKSTQVRGHAMHCACLHPLNLAGRRLAAPLLSTTYHQVPQMLLERSLSSGRGGSTSIICTQVAAPSVGHPPPRAILDAPHRPLPVQPRRIDATSLARRVAHERGESVGARGAMTGYQARPS